MKGIGQKPCTQLGGKRRDTEAPRLERTIEEINALKRTASKTIVRTSAEILKGPFFSSLDASGGRKISCNICQHKKSVSVVGYYAAGEAKLPKAYTFNSKNELLDRRVIILRGVVPS